jgi:hypothetical protein
VRGQFLNFFGDPQRIDPLPRESKRNSRIRSILVRRAGAQRKGCTRKPSSDFPLRLSVIHPAQAQNRTQISAYNPLRVSSGRGMGDHRKRDEWLQDIEARQRNVVLPDTVQNEARFWRNIGKQPSTSTKVGLALLAILGWGLFAVILVATFQEGFTWKFVLGMLLFWGPIFAAIAWATRRSPS